MKLNNWWRLYIGFGVFLFSLAGSLALREAYNSEPATPITQTERPKIARGSYKPTFPASRREGRKTNREGKNVMYRSRSLADYDSNLVALPAGTVDGDVMLATVMGMSPNYGVPTAPTGWTQIVTEINDNEDLRMTTWVKIASGEPSSYTWGTASGGSNTSLSIASYSGVNTTTPIDDIKISNPGATTSPVAPSITTTSPNETVVYIFGSETGSWSPPSGTTERLDLSVATSHMLADFVQVSAGATGSKTGICSAYGRWIVFVIALKPGSAPPAASNNAGFFTAFGQF